VRHAARTDANQKEIMDALKKVGVSVEYIKLPFDCVYYNHRNHETGFLEIKTEDGRLTKAQLEFISRWPGHVRVAKTPQEAIRLILGDEALA
jgi:hypothetical protein